MATSKRPIQSVCCIGEVMIELVNGRDGKIALGVAGDTYNTAVYMKRALKETDVTVSYCTALGTDPYSDIIRKALTGYGLDTSCIETRNDKIPGLYAVDTDEHGERSFTYWRSDAAARTLFQDPCEVSLDTLSRFDLIYVSGISMAILPPVVRARLIQFIETFRAEGGTFAYDSNYRPRLWEDQATAQEINTRMWQLADIALPSIDDEMALFEDATEADVLARLAEAGVACGALKRGAEGPLDLAGAAIAQNLNTVEKVIDSTAAGDSFNAGYLAAYVLGQPTQTQMEAGHNLAARVITHPGAIIPE
ncbi:sugar kinase [Cognatishimia maritima]|uniref:2-dehydro-3-deoxygluconokinase n=1 Tax=Cognatishimia maritima TaxID=870908 RepID=A0A1M5QYB6_9RHOB|nr:sugar kinase [Cognatishimia maritima]SHH18878.1 2-dehydro-3-deoxygluconokinase [Cognatishimia maritima]